jgi:predicted RNase H-like nuclease (RuvC/YqgF family)
MNCRISDIKLRSVCRELLRSGQPVSHRALRQVLRDRFGATGKTARVLKALRDESARLSTAKSTDDRSNLPVLPADVRELQELLTKAEARAQEMKARAELAELREQSHQDRWGLEIDRLREQLRAQPNYAREVRALQNTVTRLTVELAALRGTMVASPAGQGGPTDGAAR